MLVIGVLLMLICVPVFCLQQFMLLDKNITDTLNNLLNPNKYNKKVRPNIGGPPTLVMVNMYIKSIGPVSETEESYTMDVYFRQTWYDTRLHFSLPGLDEFSMSWLFLNKVWKPDTFFMNGKKSYLHRITSPNKFLRVRNDGFLTYSMRLTISAQCKMYLRKFPMDTQNCPLIIGSYGYTRRDVKYEWQNDGVGLEKGIELSQYDLVNISTKNNKILLRGKDEFSMIKVNLILRRNLGYFVLQIYVPLSLIVSCSWVSFWIDPKAVPARVHLGVTTVLSITTIGFGGGRAALPKVNYATALDWFIILCFAFVFGTIVEYAFINFIDKITTDIKRILEERKKKKSLDDEEKDQEIIGSKSSITPGNITSSRQTLSAAMTEPTSSTISSSKKATIPKICISLDDTDDFEDMDDNEEEMKKERKRRRKSKLSRKSVSLPTLRRESLSSNESQNESQTNYHLYDKVGAKRVLRNIMHLQKKGIEVNVEVDVPIVRIVRRNGRFHRSLRIPARMWKKIKILPNEEDIINDTEPVEIFTKLDIISRKIFPIAFIVAVTLYITFYMYYLPDLSTIEES